MARRFQLEAVLPRLQFLPAPAGLLLRRDPASILVVEAVARAVEAFRELAAGLPRYRTKAAPGRLRLTNVVAHRAPAGFVAAAPADRVRGERLAQHVGEGLRRVARSRSRVRQEALHFCAQ